MGNARIACASARGGALAVNLIEETPPGSSLRALELSGRAQLAARGGDIVLSERVLPLGRVALRALRDAASKGGADGPS